MNLGECLYGSEFRVQSFWFLVSGLCLLDSGLNKKPETLNPEP